MKKQIRLDKNENPYGIGVGVKKAINEALKDANRYPDSKHTKLKDLIATKYNIHADNISFGHGIDDLILNILALFSTEQDSILICDPSYYIYGKVARMLGRKVCKVMLKNYRVNIDAIIKSYNHKIKIILLSNPCNPTGTIFYGDDFRRLVKVLSDGDALIVVDEAYFEFVANDSYPNSLEYFDDNVIVLRTFSKAYGLAGLRIGMAMGKENHIRKIEQNRLPYNVSSVAQAAALAVLREDARSKRQIKHINNEKVRLYKEFDKLNIDYVNSETNFILLKDHSSGDMFDYLNKYNIIVNRLEEYNIKNQVRITVGTNNENDKLLEHIKLFKKHDHENG